MLVFELVQMYAECSAEFCHVSSWPLLGSVLKSGKAFVLSNSTLITDDIAEHFGMIGATRVAAERVMAHTSMQLSDPTEEEALHTHRPLPRTCMA